MPYCIKNISGNDPGTERLHFKSAPYEYQVFKLKAKLEVPKHCESNCVVRETCCRLASLSFLFSWAAGENDRRAGDTVLRFPQSVRLSA